MRSFTTIFAAVSVLAAGVFAAPEASYGKKLHQARQGACMNSRQAQRVANNYARLIRDYSDAVADRSLTEDLTVYTDSVVTLINDGCESPVPLGPPFCTDRECFKAGQGAQPDVPFEQVNMWHTCDTVVLRWRSALTQLVTGIAVLEVVPSSAGREPYLIENIYSEFNSAAWLVWEGVFEPVCPNTASRRSLFSV
ncbi:hypothetical protein LTR37_018436 [Vermiconidia calcicola]|uniref:Uncharacterized protein n=1 Tax=Vermiconidia calcicola TaxID=1690605 RepID=A0ACC3MI20_9PEZI|nr:hypothetical protein LTR37_018436 [Vermiconidia calcicola]